RCADLPYAPASLSSALRSSPQFAPALAVDVDAATSTPAWLEVVSPAAAGSSRTPAPVLRLHQTRHRLPSVTTRQAIRCRSQRADCRLQASPATGLVVVP